VNAIPNEFSNDQTLPPGRNPIAVNNNNNNNYCVASICDTF
jgi:hypothetical protein